MLERLLEREGRPSDLTYVEPSRGKGLAFAPSQNEAPFTEKVNDTNHYETSDSTHHGHGLAAQSVAAPAQAHTAQPANGVHSSEYSSQGAGETGYNIAGRPNAELGRPY